MRSAGVVKEIHKILHNVEIIRVLRTLSLDYLTKIKNYVGFCLGLSCLGFYTQFLALLVLDDNKLAR